MVSTSSVHSVVVLVWAGLAPVLLPDGRARYETLGHVLVLVCVCVWLCVRVRERVCVCSGESIEQARV